LKVLLESNKEIKQFQHSHFWHIFLKIKIGIFFKIIFTNQQIIKILPSFYLCVGNKQVLKAVDLVLIWKRRFLYKLAED